jgi:amino acid transporter
MPVNGGPQEYLTQSLNELCGFLAAYGCIFTIKPSSAAILALVMADYLCDAFGTERDALNLYRKSTAILVIALITTINCLGNKSSVLATKSLLACKVVAISLVIGTGFVVLVHPNTSRHWKQPEHRSRGLSDYADATLAAMWSYSGWETVGQALFA